MNQPSLTEQQLAELAELLRRSLAELSGEIEREREDASDSVDARRGAGVQDRGEESFAGSINAVDRALLQQHEGARRQVQAALLRMQEGSYGECQRCGEPIGYERLRVAPSASRCVRCQERAENG